MPAKKHPIDIPEPPAALRREDAAAGGVPEAAEDLTLRDNQPPEDGGVDQHPVHDDDQEDLQPEDFEEEIDAASEGGFDPTDKYEVERDAGRKMKEPGKV
jgi:hypothetical protein